LFKQTLDNDYDVEFNSTGTITFMEDVGVGQTLGYVTFNATTVDIQKLFIARGITGVPVPPSGGGGGGGGVYVPPSTTTPLIYNVPVTIKMQNQIVNILLNNILKDFYERLIEARRNDIANMNRLSSTENIFSNNPVSMPYGIVKNRFINSISDLARKKQNFKPKTTKVK
jgi:hypothetical protein